jgi:hypothetical protein
MTLPKTLTEPTEREGCAHTDLTVRTARDRFLASYALGASTYTDPRFVLHLRQWRIRTPNPGLLPLHDLHHVATGFGSGLIGEAEISAYELRTGWGNLIILTLCIGAVFLGGMIRPRRVWHAWARSKDVRGLYRCGHDYEALLDMTVMELRSYLGIPPEGLAFPTDPLREIRDQERERREKTKHG